MSKYRTSNKKMVVTTDPQNKTWNLSTFSEEEPANKPWETETIKKNYK